MKVINHIEPKYYPDKKELKQIKKEIIYKYDSLERFARDIFGCTYKTLWQKLTNSNGAYLTHMELQKLQACTGIIFKLH